MCFTLCWRSLLVSLDACVICLCGYSPCQNVVPTAEFSVFHLQRVAALLPQPSPFLVLDEDLEFCSTVARRFMRRGFTVRAASRVSEITPIESSQGFDICLMKLGPATELNLAELKVVGLLAPNCQLVLLVSREQLENAADALPLGTSDCLAKPLIWAELDWRILRAQERAQAGTRGVPAISPRIEVAPPVADAASTQNSHLPSVADALKLDTLATVQRAHIVEVLRREAGNKARTARALGVNRRSLYRLIDKFKIELDVPLPPQ
ncbi:MAG: helix-turn-helix domain-containing protein [Pirellulales bacterium]